MVEVPKFMMVFDVEKFFKDPVDESDNNFYVRCEIMHTYQDDDELLAVVKWPDGLITRGYPVSDMQPIKENA